MKKKTSVSAAYLLQLMFVYLKLTGEIDWGWWYVLIPFFIHVLMVLFGITDEEKEK